MQYTRNLQKGIPTSVRSRSVEHLRDNLSVLDDSKIQLSSGLMNWMDNVHADYKAQRFGPHTAIII